ncbi:hypothetical protein COCOBI_14-0770 [Coccomyxa sp. Obi]|nr:hypothetical protein COCOBI_14-0770 [Coccomyxa sp. Obi]
MGSVDLLLSELLLPPRKGSAAGGLNGRPSGFLSEISFPPHFFPTRVDCQSRRRSCRGRGLELRRGADSFSFRSFSPSQGCGEAKWMGQGGGTPRSWVEVPPLVTAGEFLGDLAGQYFGPCCLPTICCTVRMAPQMVIRLQ